MMIRAFNKELDLFAANLEISHQMQAAFSYCCENDEDWTMHQIDQSCSKLLGFNADSILSHDVTFASMIHVDDRQRCWDIVQFAMNSQRPFQSLYRIITAENELKLVYEHGLGVYSKSGKLKEIRGFISDAKAEADALTKRVFSVDLQHCIEEIKVISEKHELHVDQLQGDITEKEMAIVMLSCLGKSTKEIALELHLSPRTIEAYVSRLRKKIGCATSAQLKQIFLQT